MRVPERGVTREIASGKEFEETVYGTLFFGEGEV